MTALTLHSPDLQLARDVANNPYAALMTARMVGRIDELNAAQRGEHWASLRHELDVARLTLDDVLQFYAGMKALPDDNAQKQAAMMGAGSVVRDAIREVGTIARLAAQIEREVMRQHDPAITIQVVQNIVRVADRVLREAEERGDLRDADRLIAAIADSADGAGHQAIVDGTLAPTGITPSAQAQVQAMIDTVPLATA